MQVVILAGGLGTRLKPLTEKITKVMVEVHGKPFLEHQFRYLKKFGFKKILLLVSYLGDQVKNYFQDGQAFGIKIEYNEEKEPMGTAGALKMAAPKLERSFLLINGDTFYPLNWKDFLSRADAVRQGGLIAVYQNQERVAENNLKVEPGGLISACASNKSPQGLNGVDGGVSFYHKAILDFIPEGEKCSLEKDIYPLLIRQKLLKAYFSNQRYYDMGTFERLDVIEKVLS